MSQDNKDKIMCAVFAAALTIAITIIIDVVTRIPVVTSSWSTGECVEVQVFDDSPWHCGRLPHKYTHVWTE